MRYGIVLAATALAMPVTGMVVTNAHAEDCCGYASRPGAIVQCGYSSLEGCESVIGKGGMCFINPFVAINDKRTAPANGITATARKG